MRLDLHTTIDFYDDLLYAERFFEPHEYDAMFARLASLGMKRVNWIIHTWWGLDQQPIAGHPDLLSFLVETAHSHGLELYACIKPYECGFSVPGRSYFPHTLPQPDGVPFINDLRGLTVLCDPFTAAHPHLRYKRKPGDWTVDREVARIDLIKLGVDPTRVRPEHLSIHVGEENGRLEPFDCRPQFVETIEWRDGFPSGQECRVLSLRGLNIPSRYRYVFVRCSLTGGDPDFGNTPLRLMEIYDSEGGLLPSTPAEERIDPSKVGWPWPENTTAYYGLNPDVQAFFADREKVEAACQDLYVYDRRTAEPFAEGPKYLDERGFAGVACGKNEYLQGPLNLVYPEVQEYWLGVAEASLAAGVDGINIRFAGHSAKAHERDEYGLGEPQVVAGAMMENGRIDRQKAHQINGDAVTQWLARLRTLTWDRRAKMAVHIHSSYMYRDERTWRASHNTPPAPNTEFQWKRWIDEVHVDEVTLKIQNLSRARHDHFVDSVCNAAAAADVKVTYVGGASTAPEANCGQPSMHRRMAYADADPRINAFDFYEVAFYARLLQDGVFEVNPSFVEFLRKYNPRAGQRELEPSAEK